MRRRSLLSTAVAAAAWVAIAASLPASAQRIKTEVATFAGGCYWCTEADFDKVEGVVSTTPGFMGGKTENPTYKAVTGGRTGHTEVVRIEFDPAKVSYARLVEIFWRTIDPLDGNGQFCDRGDSYRPAIFTHDDQQKAVAETSRKRLAESGRFKQPLATEVAAAAKFWPSDRPEDHDFYKKHAGHYVAYRAGCGRDARLKALWGEEAGGKVPTQ